MSLIAEKRIEMGFTQDEVARATGIPLRTYVRIEGMKDGFESAKAGNLQKIAIFLKCSIDDLLNPPQASGEHISIEEPVKATK